MTDQFEELGEGRRIVRGVDGKFEKAHLDTETARQMGSRTWKAGIETGSRKILTDRGLDPDNCDEALITLAEISASKRSGAVQALRYLDSLTGRNQAVETYKPAPGETCPTCGKVQVVLPELSPEAITELALLMLDGQDPSVVRRVFVWVENQTRPLATAQLAP